MQPGTGTSGTLNTNFRICGAVFSAGASPQTAQATACSYTTPFKIGVHFDEEVSYLLPNYFVIIFYCLIFKESISAAPIASPNLNKMENDPAATNGAGFGYSGFWLNYWQNSC